MSRASAGITQSPSILLSCLSSNLQSFHELEAFPESFNGSQSCSEEEPAKYKDPYCESDLPSPLRLRTPPNQWQRQGAHATDCNDNNGFAEIPWNALLRKGCQAGRIQKFTAVFTLYRLVLNLFSAEWARLHRSSFISLGRTSSVRLGDSPSPASGLFDPRSVTCINSMLNAS